MQSTEWLRQVREEIVDPEREICDPHHHVWDYPGSRYLLREFMEDVTDGPEPGLHHNVTATVYAECDVMYRADGPRSLAPVGETEFARGIAAMSASGAYGECRVAEGIIGFADLNLGEGVRDVLLAHLDAAPGRFKGIRHAAAWDAHERVRNAHTHPTNHMMLSDSFNEGMAVMGDLGLSFEAWCFHPQLADVLELAKAHPTVPIVLNHLGGPVGVGPYADRQDEIFPQWQDSVAQLESAPNIHVKLGGINMKVNGFGWHARPRPATSGELVDRTGRYYEFCIDTFGAERCMFESNFPVDRESVSYSVLWNAFKKLTATRPDADKDQLFSGTARRVYRLS